ncbi:MAG: ComEC/Rec2 family competence protein [Clostridiales bacterium]|nr:ComEC/Rec2 family competence protein [Clostridiales bacterium]
MKKEKERIVNIRFLACVFIGLMIGIIISKLFFVNNIGIGWLIALSCLILIVASVLFGYGVFCSKKYKNNLSMHKVGFLIKCSCIGVLVAYLVGVLITIIPFNKVTKVESYNGDVVVSGVVSDYVDYESTYTKFVMSDCKIVVDGSVSQEDIKVLVYSSTYCDVVLGDTITMIASLDRLDVNSGYDFSRMADGVYYSTYVNVDDMVVASGDKSIRDSIHNKVMNLLKDNLSEDNANICFAILFGKKQGISDTISQMFSYAGISHILAVSGLHVGVLVTIIWFVADRVKINKYVKLIIFVGVLLGYAYLCEFSPSVCRAVIMSSALALCKTARWEYDSLSSLSLAGIVILLISPLELFGVSFQLSFMCIFAIITLSPAISQLFDKIHCPKKLGDTLALSIAVNLAILPICMNTFNSVSLLGILSNIFILPIFSVAYVLLFGVVLLSVIIPGLGFLLSVPNLLLDMIKLIAMYINAIPIGVFKVFASGYWVIVVLCLSALTMKYYLNRTWVKGVVAGVTMGVVCVIMITALIPKSYNNGTMIIANQHNSNVVLCIEEDETILMGSNISCDNLTFMLKDIKIKDIDCIVAYDLQLNNIDNLIDIITRYNIQEVIIPDSLAYEEVVEKFDNPKVVALDIDIGNTHISLIERSDKVVAIRLTGRLYDMLIPNMDNKVSDNRYLIEYYLSDVTTILVDSSYVWDDLEYSGEVICVDKISRVVIGG